MTALIETEADRRIMFEEAEIQTRYWNEQLNCKNQSEANAFIASSKARDQRYGRQEATYATGSVGKTKKVWVKVLRSHLRQS